MSAFDPLQTFSWSTYLQSGKSRGRRYFMCRILCQAAKWASLAGFCLLFVTFGMAVSAADSGEIFEIVPGVTIKKRQFPSPPNVQPFYGFAEKSAEQKSADEVFVKKAVEMIGDRQKASIASVKAGFEAVNSKDCKSAMARFNQAFLLDRKNGPLYFGYAICVLQAYKDPTYAQELLRVHYEIDPSPMFQALELYGMMLLRSQKFSKAVPVFTKATNTNPGHFMSWLNLGWAKFLSGDRKGACTIVVAVGTHPKFENEKFKLQDLAAKASC